MRDRKTSSGAFQGNWKVSQAPNGTMMSYNSQDAQTQKWNEGSDRFGLAARQTRQSNTSHSDGFDAQTSQSPGDGWQVTMACDSKP